MEEQWNKVLNFFKQNFTDGEEPEMDVILFLIGIQELGKVKKQYSKDEKINLMHVATCKLLEPYGYYHLENIDEDGWPHYKKVKDIPVKTPKEQENLMKDAIINYFKKQNLL